MFGLTDKSYRIIKEILSELPQIEQAIIFGSRAMGNYKKGSDVDIAIKGKNIDPQLVIKLNTLLNEEMPLPYFFDIVHFEKLNNEKLKEHIKKEGKLFFSSKVWFEEPLLQ